LIRGIEFEVDSIDELVLILKESEQSDMLRRIGYCRKRMMSLLRLLVTKSDVVKTLIKRGQVKRPAISPEVVIYLGDVQGLWGYTHKENTVVDDSPTCLVI
jgi:magnesium transporter